MQSIKEHTKKEVCPIIVPSAASSLGSFNCFLVNDGSTLTLIDAAIDTEESWQLLNFTLQENGWGLADIDRVLLTHHHADHVGLLPRILETNAVPVYAHRDAVPRLKMDTDFLAMRYDFFVELYTKMDCLQDAEKRLERMKKTIRQARELELNTDIIPVRQGDEIAGFSVIETPGHSPDSISFFDEQQRWLFSGDVLLKHSSTNALIDPDREGRLLPSVAQQRDTLARCFDLAAQTLFPGHQEIISDHRRVIQQKLAKMDRKAEKLLQLLDGQQRSASNLAKAYYGGLYENQFSLVMSEIIGYLHYLEAEGTVVKTLKDGIWLFENGNKGSAEVR